MIALTEHATLAIVTAVISALTALGVAWIGVGRKADRKEQDEIRRAVMPTNGKHKTLGEQLDAIEKHVQAMHERLGE